MTNKWQKLVPTNFLNPKRISLSQAFMDIIIIALYYSLVHTLRQRSGTESHLIWILATKIKTADIFFIFGMMLLNVAWPAFFLGWSFYKVEGASKWWRNTGMVLLAMGAGMLGIVGNISIAVVRDHNTGISIILALFLGIGVFALCNIWWSNPNRPKQRRIDGILKVCVPAGMACMLLFWHYLSISLGMLLSNSDPEMREYKLFFLILNLFLSGFLPIRIGYHMLEAKNLINLALVLCSIIVYLRSTLILLHQLM